MINIISSSRYRLSRKKLKTKAGELLQAMGETPDKVINIVFIGKNKMRQLASTYKNENVALPVLSFAYKDEKLDDESLIGELFICYPQAVLLAAERNRRVEETILSLIKHGLENLFK